MAASYRKKVVGPEHVVQIGLLCSWQYDQEFGKVPLLVKATFCKTEIECDVFDNERILIYFSFLFRLFIHFFLSSCSSSYFTFEIVIQFSYDGTITIVKYLNMYKYYRRYSRCEETFFFFKCIIDKKIRCRVSKNERLPK